MLAEWEKSEAENIEYKPLMDVAVLNPDSYGTKDAWDYINYLDTSSITENSVSELCLIKPNEEKIPSRAKRKLKKKDIVYSTVRPNQKHYGLIITPAENMLASTGFVVVRSKSELVSSELIYLSITKNEVTEKMQQIAEQSTSTFPSIRPADLATTEVPCPKNESSRDCLSVLSDIFEVIDSNSKEIKRLSELRDTLLPKLMSGEMDVSDLDI